MPMQVTTDGLQIQTLQEIRQELFDALRQPAPVGFGPDFILQDTEIVPTIMSLVAERIYLVQAFAKALVDCFVPGAARGVHADNIAAITGTERLLASSSTVEVQLTGTIGETIPTGRVFRHDPTGTLWDQIEDVLLDGSGLGTTTIRAQEVGPIEIVASTEWTIVIGDPDLTSLESLGDSDPGRLRETDEELEERRKEELARAGAATPGAIRADVQQDLAELGYEVDAVAVFINNRHFFVSGRPPHSVEVLLDDNGLVPDAVIAAVIWEVVGGGIRPWGTTIVSFVDADGEDREAGFSRTTSTEVWIRATLYTFGAEVTITDTDGVAAAVADALLGFADAAHKIGRDVIPGRFVGTCFATAPAGGVTSVVIEVSDDGIAYQTDVLDIDARASAVFDLARIEVLIVEVAP